MPYTKNIPYDEIFQIASQVEVLDGQVVSKTVVQNSAVSITIFAFDKGEEISTHESKGDAIVTVIDGVGKFTVDGKTHILCKGDSLVMPANKPHAVFGEKQFKMILVVIFPSSKAENPLIKSIK